MLMKDTSAIKTLFKESKDTRLWEKIRKDKAYESFRKDLDEGWNLSNKEPIMPLTFDLFMVYMNTGSRWEYEQAYFRRRLALNSSFMCFMIYGDEKYLKRLENVIMLICDEYTWALPACGVDTETDCETVSTYIELFAAETGHALSEILYILGDKLNKHVSSRIRYEVNRRIINSFLNNTYRFEEMKLNWAAVCGGCVGMIYIYMAPEKFPLVKARIKASLENYIDCFGDDGVSTEGIGYWAYGFGYYLYFEELHKEFSGSYLIPQGKKHKEIAMFFQRANISGDLSVSFSDTGIHNAISPAMVLKLHDIYGEDIHILPKDAYTKKVVTGGGCYRFAHCIRNFLWYKPERIPKDGHYVKETLFLKDAQWYIKKADNYAFAAKGGNNAEPHNHNDVGCFIISDRKDQLLADVGMGKYTRQYFDEETRYQYLCCSSRGHSVPIINGHEQCAGKECKAKILEESDTHLIMDIGAAYNNDDIISVIRRFDFSDSTVKLADEINQKQNAQWIDRLISIIEPELDGNVIQIGGMRIYNNLSIVPVISSEDIDVPGVENKQRRVYLIDNKTELQKIEFSFEF